MNFAQKTLSLVAFGLFLVSVFYAPWIARIEMNDSTILTLGTIYSPLWQGPPRKTASTLQLTHQQWTDSKRYISVELRFGLLAVEWVLIVATYGVLVQLSKTALRKNEAISN